MYGAVVVPDSHIPTYLRAETQFNSTVIAESKWITAFIALTPSMYYPPAYGPNIHALNNGPLQTFSQENVLDVYSDMLYMTDYVAIDEIHLNSNSGRKKRNVTAFCKLLLQGN